MAQRVEWSHYAEKDQGEILRYWAKRNKSKSYPRKLHRMIASVIEAISKNPNRGHQTDLPSVYYEYVRTYRIYYEIAGDRIIILRIWDGPRNPDHEPF